MIRQLTGRVASTTSSSITIIVGGIGYHVFTPTPEAISKGTELTVHTYLAVRETALDLYGFLNELERDLFIELLRVPKIGPKSALQTLTQATPHVLLTAIVQNDAAYLQKLSSVGKKTCENIVQQLHGKLSPELETASSATSTDLLNQTQLDAVEALVALGYDTSAAKQAVQNAPDQTEQTTVNQLVTHALKNM